MNQQDIIRMAREAEIGDSHGYIIANELAHLERFAALVAAAERAECEKVCVQISNDFGDVAEGPFVTDFGKHTHMSMAAGAENCAAAIRARGETK